MANIVLCSDEGGHSEEDDMFDTIVGAIQNILVDGGETSEFSRLMDSFLKTHAPVFVDSEENKLEYMDIFKKYVCTTLNTMPIKDHLKHNLQWVNVSPQATHDISASTQTSLE